MIILLTFQIVNNKSQILALRYEAKHVLIDFNRVSRVPKHEN